MGNDQPKQIQPQVKKLDQFKIDVACLKVKGYCELNRDRRMNQALVKEKNLQEMMRSGQRVKVDEYQKLQSLVTDIFFIDACNLVIRCCEVLKEQSIRIQRCDGDPSKIVDLMPYIETILFAADKLNLAQVMEFKDLMVFYFGPQLYDTSKLMAVDPELRKLFKNPIPDAFEVNEFALKFAQKFGFSEDQLNQPGHQFSSKYLAPQVGGVNPQYGEIGQGAQSYSVGIDAPPQYNQFAPPPNSFGQGFGQPGGFPPSNGFAPPPTNNGFAPPSNGFAPPNNGFAPPPPNGFNPPSNGFAPPPPNGFAPPPNGFAPPPNGFAPPPNNNFPPPNQGFGAPSNGFTPNNGFTGNPYQNLQNQQAPPPIMVSTKLKAPNSLNQNQPAPQSNDLDDLEARLKRLNGEL